MKRGAALVGIGAMLTWAPAAGAVPSAYEGTTAAGGPISLVTKTTKKKMKNGKRKRTSVLVKFLFERLPVDCGGDARTTSGGVSNTRTKIRDGRFRFTALIGDRQDPTYAMTIQGAVGKRSASGTVRVSGSQVPLDDGWGLGDCDGAPVSWSASK